MKKLLFSLAAMLMASSAFAGHWVTFEAENFDYTSGDFFVENEDVIIQGYGRIDYDHFRFYANRSLTVTHDAGIMKIEFTCIGEDDGEYGPGNIEYEGQRGYYSYSGNVGLWEDGIYQSTNDSFTPYDEDSYSEEGGVSPVTVIEFVPDHQVRCTSIKVYVLDDGETPPDVEVPTAPVITVQTNDLDVVLGATEVEGAVVTFYQCDDQDGNNPVEIENPTSFVRETENYVVYVYAVATNAAGETSSVVTMVVIPARVLTAIDELTNGKTVAGVRYFNMAGQEMTEANGMTIMVTTYTDGTTSAVKVVK